MSKKSKEPGTVYLLRSRKVGAGNRETCVGATRHNMVKRLSQHNAGQVKDTRGFRPLDVALWIENLDEPFKLESNIKHDTQERIKPITTTSPPKEYAAKTLEKFAKTLETSKRMKSAAATQS